MLNFFKNLRHPERYHGHGATAPYFEGWYYKIVNKAEDKRYAFIPGVFIHQNDAETHAFIQVLDGIAGTTAYHRYGNFEAKPDTLDVRVGQSNFTQDHIHLNINDEQNVIRGELTFTDLNPWPSTTFWIGYMGPYAWIPNLECNHGVLSFHHEISGQLEINGEIVDFTGGRGYIEKDWGKSFPEGYIWFQTNHFEQDRVSLTASIATLPVFGRTTVGFNVGLWIDGKLYIWSKYNGSKVDRLVVTDQVVEWVLYNNHSELKLRAHRAEGGLLMGPERTAMQKRVEETMAASVEVEVTALEGTRRQVIFSGEGRNMGLEVVGDISKIISI